MKTLHRPALLATLAVIIVAAFASIAVGNVLTTAVPVPTCTYPTGTMTEAKHAAYSRCRFDRLEAQGENQHGPVPTVTATVTETVTATPTTTPTPTPTSPPAGAMKGWELTTTNVGLAPHGLSCDGLPEYTGARVLEAGTTISGRRFTVPIDVSAGNIVVEKSCFKPTTADVGLVEGYYPQGVITIRDSEFDGSLVPPAAREGAFGFTGGANLLRNYVHDVGLGIGMVSSTNTRDQGEIPKNLLIENNYVHRLFHYNDAHHEAATIRDFVKNADDTRTMRWVGNYLQSDSLFVSGGMFIQPTFEPIHNVWLEGNVFAGEGFNLWLTDSGCCVTRNVHVVDNRMKEGTREWYGPVHVEGPGIVEWSENYLYDGSKPDARGDAVTP